MALDPGTRIGPYEIVAAIGAGGMGEVYRARDSRLQRDVAIKVLRDRVAADPERLARFQREAQLLASLNHPHIAGIYGLEEAEDLRALVLELVEGETLADRIARGPIPLDEALPIARQVAQALEASHEQGIIHRDLKPANIKLTPNGIVKVLDFGLAKFVEPSNTGPANVDRSLSPTITSPALMTGMGVLLGTAAYMAPEQAKGRPADKRSDVWAFGCVLYEMVSGKRPFDGEDVSDVIAAVLRGQPDWAALPNRLPRQVRVLMQDCLARDRQMRLADVSTAAWVLRPDLLNSPPEGTAVGSWRRPAFAAIGTGVALITAAVVWFAGTTSDVSPPARFTIEGPSPNPNPDVPQVSPDGRYVGAVGPDERGVGHLWIRPLASDKWTMLAGTERADNPFWSPDSRAIGFSGGTPGRRLLRKIDVVAGRPETLCDIPSGPPIGNASWGKQGDIVYAPSTETKGTVIWRVSAKGGACTPVTTLAPHEIQHAFPSFLPDGEHFLYFSRGETDESDAIYVGSVAKNERARVVASNAAGQYAAGRLLYLRGTTLVAQPFDARTFKVTGEPQVIAEGVGTDAWGFADFSASASGIVITGARSDNNAVALKWVDRRGRDVDVVAERGFFRTFDVSPDEKHVAVHIHDPRSAAGNLWVVDAERHVTSRFTTGASHDIAPLWSGDGEAVLFVSTANGQTAIYEKRVVGNTDPKLVMKADQNAILESRTADGKHLLYELRNPDRTSPGELWAIAIGSSKRAVGVRHGFDDRYGTFSADGRWVAFASTESGKPEVYVQSYPAGDVRVRVSNDGGSEPQWRQDSRELFYVSADGYFTAAPVELRTTPVIGRPEKLFAFRAGAGVDGTNHYRVGRNGDRFLIMSDPAHPSNASDAATVILNWPALLKAN